MLDDNSGHITNAGCPNLAISSSKKKSVNHNSIYFALQNPRTQLAVGVAAGECMDGMQINLQELVYGSANQQFVYDQEHKTIVCFMCPEYAIEVPGGNCSSTAELHLSNKVDTSNDGRNQWIFEKENMIRSVNCADMFITINSASGGEARTVVVPTNQLVPSANGGSNSGTRLSGQGEVSLQGTIIYIRSLISFPSCPFARRLPEIFSLQIIDPTIFQMPCLLKTTPLKLIQPTTQTKLTSLAQ